MTRPKHLPDQSFFENLKPAVESPIPVLFSACLTGIDCAWDGANYNDFTYMHQIKSSPLIKPVPFCPEDFSFGTPRMLSDIYGGDGFDVLDGKAKVIAENGDDWTEKMIVAANWMTGIAVDNKVKFAILLDISAACGSQVIYDGNRKDPDPVYQIGMGVCAARLTREGIPVVSQRDHKTLGYLLDVLNIEKSDQSDGMDHHERQWYQEYFKSSLTK